MLYINIAYTLEKLRVEMSFKARHWDLQGRVIYTGDFNIDFTNNTSKMFK